MLPKVKRWPYNKTIRFLFQPLVSCWLLNRNSTSCWLLIIVFYFWPWIIRRAKYDLKATFRIGSNDDADDGWLVSYLVCIFAWIRHNNFRIMKRNWALFLPLFQGFSTLTHNPHGFFVWFHIVPRILFDFANSSTVFWFVLQNFQGFYQILM